MPMEEKPLERCKSVVKKLREELIEEIIRRLPPRSVARFKCVSSRWWRRLSKQSFVERYQSRNISLLGFVYNKSFNRIRFTPIPGNIPPDNSAGGSQQTRSSSSDFVYAKDNCKENIYTLVDSSNGLQLFYSSNCTVKDPWTEFFYFVRNAQTGDSMGIPRFYTASLPLLNVPKRFFAFGFAFDPYGTHDVVPHFTIVELTNDDAFMTIGNNNINLRNHFKNVIKSITYSSLDVPRQWNSKRHAVPASLGDDFTLSGPSTFFHGSLHWLLGPSGVVAYNIRDKSLSFSLVNIPGDRDYLDHKLCGCIKKMRKSSREGDIKIDNGGASSSSSNSCYSNGECSCRYLGECRDRLIYIRVTGDGDFSLWTLEDYYGGRWSHRRRIVIDNLPMSLFFGRVLAFDRRYPHVLFLRLKRKIFTYHCITRRLEFFCEISKDYGGQENCLGFVIPHELPTLPAAAAAAALFIPGYDHHPLSVEKPSHKKKREIKPNAYGHYINNNNGIHKLFHHFGVSQLGIKFFPHQEPLGGVDTTGPPVRSSYDFFGPLTAAGMHDAAVLYNDFIRVEACLYGCVSERTNQNQ